MEPKTERIGIASNIMKVERGSGGRGRRTRPVGRSLAMRPRVAKQGTPAHPGPSVCAHSEAEWTEGGTKISFIQGVLRGTVGKGVRQRAAAAAAGVGMRKARRVKSGGVCKRGKGGIGRPL